jgi:hypothetical protein
MSIDRAPGSKVVEVCMWLQHNCCNHRAGLPVWYRSWHVLLLLHCMERAGRLVQLLSHAILLLR